MREGSGLPWTTVIAATALLLVLANLLLTAGNRELRNEANERQQFINQSIRLNRLNSQLIRSLANLAAQNNDEQIRSLLSANGVSFTINDRRRQTAESAAPSG